MTNTPNTLTVPQSDVQFLHNVVALNSKGSFNLLSSNPARHRWVEILQDINVLATYAQKEARRWELECHIDSALPKSLKKGDWDTLARFIPELQALAPDTPQTRDLVERYNFAILAEADKQRTLVCELLAKEAADRTPAHWNNLAEAWVKAHTLHPDHESNGDWGDLVFASFSEEFGRLQQEAEKLVNVEGQMDLESVALALKAAEDFWNTYATKLVFQKKYALPSPSFGPLRYKYGNAYRSEATRRVDELKAAMNATPVDQQQLRDKLVAVREMTAINESSDIIKEATDLLEAASTATPASTDDVAGSHAASSDEAPISPTFPSKTTLLYQRADQALIVALNTGKKVDRNKAREAIDAFTAEFPGNGQLHALKVRYNDVEPDNKLKYVLEKQPAPVDGNK